MKLKQYLFGILVCLYAGASFAQTPTQQVAAIQYYYDTDPGVGIAGNGAVIQFTPTTNYNQTLSLTLPVLNNGFHNLYIRGRDEFGRWSLAERRLFYIYTSANTENIIAYQYYFDTDPGVGVNGNGAVVAISQINTFSATLNITVPSNLSSGIHTLYVRAQDVSGQWSLAERRVFYVNSSQLSEAIIAYQYFFDTDPGVGVAGNGAVIPVAPVNNFSSVVNISLPTNLNAGIHSLFIRGQDVSGQWSLAERRVFYISKDQITTEVTAMEYFFDTDPGVGNANQYPITPGASINITSNIGVPCLINGTHFLYVRGKDLQGRWSIIERDTLTVTSGIASSVVTPTGPVTICNTDSVLLSTNIVAGATYQWLFNGADIIGANSTAFYAHNSGNYSIKTTCGVSFTTSNVVVVNTLPILTYFADADGDGFGDPLVDSSSCIIPFGFIADSTDCNDGDYFIHPGITEICNGLDDNCDGQIDEGLFQIYYADADGDGYGDINADSLSCSQPSGYISDSTDCDDALGSVNPGAIEICFNGIDDNCNGLIDEGPSVDAGPDQNVCADSTFMNAQLPFNGNGIVITNPSSGVWSVVSGNGNFSDSTIANTLVTNLGTGINVFRWTVTQDSCVAYDEVTVFSTQNYAADLSGLENEYCLNDPPVILTGLPSGGTFSGNGISGNIFTPAFPGINTIQYIAPPYFGCAADTVIKTTLVRALPSAAIASSAGFVICQGATTTLSSGTSAVTYLWNTGSSLSQISVSSSGTYTLTVTDEFSCSNSSAPVVITVESKPSVTVNGSTGICPGETRTLTFAGMSSVQWNTGATSSSIVVSPTIDTKYVVNGISFAGCSYSDSVMITVNPSLPPGAVTNMLPANNTSGLNIPVNLSWFPGAYNTSFDLFVWPSSGSQPVSPTVANITSLNYQLTTGLGFGVSYNWRVRSKNGNCFSIDGPVQSFTTRSLPDLVVNNIQAPVSAFSGQNISISWQVNNAGTGNTSNAAWTDAVYFSLDTVLQPFDIYIGGASAVSALIPGQSYNNNKTYTIPQNVAGAYYILVVSDKFSQLLESEESNNMSYTSMPVNISIPPFADLVVESIIAPNNAFSGDTITISYSVKNIGGAATTSGSWADAFYVSEQPFLNPLASNSVLSVAHQGNLLPDSAYTVTLQLPLPKHVFGPFYIYANTDVANVVFENIAEGNNQNSTIIQIFLTPPPDITVSAVDAPLTANNMQTVNVNWTVVNQGFTPTDAGWTDRLYLTTNAVYDLNGAQVLLSKPVATVLQPGGFYSTTQSVLIPEVPAGNYYIYAQTDASNTLFEYTGESNNILRTVQPLIISNPDLQVTNVTAPGSASAGNQININWQVTNQGAGEMLNRTRKDFIFLQIGSTFNMNTALVVDSVSYTETIASGATRSKQKTIQLPNNLNGTFRLFVFADRRGNILEADENNNVNVVPPVISINLSSWADLSATSFSVPDTVQTIVTFSGNYTAVNIGTLAGNGTWSDSVFISKKSTWNRDSSLFLRTFSQTRYLNPGDLYNQSGYFSLPMTQTIPNGTDSSVYYFYVVLDATNNLFENTGEGNNIYRSGGVFVYNNYVDHIVTDVSGADTAYSGMPYQVDWSVQNLGGINNTTYYNSWRDQVLLSSDTVINAGTLHFGSTVISNPLQTNQSYNRQRTFNIPNGISGNYYLMVFTNYDNAIPGEIKRTNNVNLMRDVNGIPVTVHIIGVPPPDLSIVYTEVPSSGISGQPVKIKYSVQNIGSGSAHPQSWQDAVYLSTNTNPFVIDGQLLGTKNYSGGLIPGAIYTDSTEVSLPISASGNYFLKLGIDHVNTVYEGGSENNNKGNALITITQPPPSDLIVSSVLIPDTVISGTPVTISYTLVNSGSNPATGITKEGIYFSNDSVWDIDDVLFGIVNGTVNIPPGGSDTHSLTALVNGVSLGYKYVLVRADLQNNIFESNENNNNGYSANQVFVNVKNLPLNVLTPDIVYNNQFLYYKIDIADTIAGQTLLVTLDGANLNWANELYMSFESVPTRSNFEYSFSNPNTGDQEIIIPVLTEGTYYIAAYGIYQLPSAPPTQSVTLKAEILPFAIRSVNSNKGGNTGNVTVKIEGSKYVPGMQAKLLSTNSSLEIEASNIIYINSNKLFATFSLNQKPLGVYDVKLQKSNGDTAMLSNGFEIEHGNSGGFYVGGVSNSGQTGSPNAPGCSPGAEAGISGQLQINVNSPANALSLSVVPMSILFGNAGNMDIPTPTRMLVSPDQLPVGMTIPALNDNKYEIYMEFEEQGGPPGILRAGATGTISFYVYTTRTSGVKKFKLQ
jgi:subtilase family serine protease